MNSASSADAYIFKPGFILLIAAAAPYGHDHDESAQDRLIAPLTIRVLSAPSQDRGVIR